MSQCEHRSFIIRGTDPVKMARCCDCEELIDIIALINGNRFRIVVLEEGYRG